MAHDPFGLVPRMCWYVGVQLSMWICVDCSVGVSGCRWRQWLANSVQVAARSVAFQLLATMHSDL